MSDLVYSFERKQPGELSAAMRAISIESPPPVMEFHGEWGSFAVSRNTYRNFQLMEDESTVFASSGSGDPL